MTVKRRLAIFGLGVLALLALALITLWFQRKPIAKDYLDTYLTQKGVTARYEITDVGTKRQRLEKIVIGDPARPDLTADWAEVDVALLSGGTVRAVRAGGVRLKGRLVNGTLSLGAVDKLLPAPTGEPFRLPDIDVTLSDAGMALDTGQGLLALGVAGKGNLADGFAGQLVGTSAALGDAACKAADMTVRGAIRISDRKPAFQGPVTLGRLACAGAAASGVTAMVDASSDEQFSQWAGKASLKGRNAVYGTNRAATVSVSTRFSGNKPLTKASFDANLSGLFSSQVQASSARLAGTLDMGFGAPSGPIIASAGTINASGVTAAQDILRQAQAMRTTASGTPIAPIAKSLADALARLGQGSTVSAAYDLEQRDGKGGLSLTNVFVANPGGARLQMRGSPSVRLGWPKGRLDLAGSATLSGGGFPKAEIAFSGRGVAGRALVSPMQAGSARLTLTPVRFDFNTGTRLETVLVMDGPLGSGSVKGVRIPFAMRPGRDIFSGCQPIGFERLDIAGLRLSPGNLATCLTPQGARIVQPKLAGQLGATPIRISGQSAQIGFAKGDFTVEGLGIRLATKPGSDLDIAALSGSMSGGGASGVFSGAKGQLGAVPVLFSKGDGRWSFGKGGLFQVSGAGTVSDAAADIRFNPLITQDMVLKLLNGRIDAAATLREPLTGIAVTRVDLHHLLGPGTGQARIDVDNLTFDKSLQPELITPITKGMIAIVNGTVDGKGTVNWSPQGVTSDGAFRTDMLDFAAAFGPVSGLKGEIRLSDLLGMSTPPSQSVYIRSINPGIAVIDGEIRYQLLPGLKAQIEGGRWPFAGGALVLEPTILDMAHESERRFTFRVEGVDAAAFINQLEFENISATGIFDGTLPMVFDVHGGRIEGGQLVARAGGGTIAYVGELSNENLGVMGSFAFDALKSMKYERLTIDLAGAVDGDIVTRVNFKGVTQAPLGAPRKKLPIPVIITGLDNFPFIFNITITAPFRKLFDMSRTISDPSLLLERLNPNLQRVGPAKPIQPTESQDVRKKP